jgi:hypothetical protein
VTEGVWTTTADKNYGAHGIVHGNLDVHACEGVYRRQHHVPCMLISPLSFPFQLINWRSMAISSSPFMSWPPGSKLVGRGMDSDVRIVPPPPPRNYYLASFIWKLVEARYYFMLGEGYISMRVSSCCHVIFILCMKLYLLPIILWASYRVSISCYYIAIISQFTCRSANILILC